MSNAVFPVLPGVKLGSRTKTPMFKTKIQTTVSDRELRTSYTSYPRWQFSLGFEYLRAAQQHREWQILLGFFNARRGSFDSFLYDDPDDNQATDQTFAVGDGVTTQFKLVRELGNFIEPIAAINGPATFTVDGAAVVPTVDATAGMVTFAAPPAAQAVLKWSGKFYFRCRFLQDRLEFSRFLKDFWSANKVEFISIK
jgi:uncharacterized protein (TIGR02217 family)